MAKKREDQNNKEARKGLPVEVTSNLKPGNYAGKLLTIFDRKEDHSSDYALYALKSEKTFIMADNLKGNRFPEKVSFSIADGKIVNLKGE